MELFAVDTFKCQFNQNTHENGWINIGRLPFSYALSNPVKVTNNEFIIATTTHPKQEPDYSGIWSYNIVKKCWNFICKYQINIIQIQLNYMYIHLVDFFQ